MGYWGTKSYENDTTFDLLLSVPDRMTRHQINESINRAFIHSQNKEEWDVDGWDNKTALLGTVMFCFSLGHEVRDKKHLEAALKIAQDFLVNKKYINGWREPETRISQLQQDIQTIKEAING